MMNSLSRAAAVYICLKKPLRLSLRGFFSVAETATETAFVLVALALLALFTQIVLAKK